MSQAQASAQKSRPASASSRLGITLFLAALLHALIILGLGFSLPPPAKPSKTLEVSLATFKDEPEPEDAEFVAQSSQQGSGSLDEARTPTTTDPAPFQDTRVNPVTPPVAPPEAAKPAPQQRTVTTQGPSREQVAQTRKQEPRPEPTRTARPRFDASQLSAEIASLEAELADEIEEYAKRPRVNRQNSAATKRDVSAWYRAEWRKKVERIGNLNYPDEARRRQIYGSLRLLVTINRDGSVAELQVLESSGEPILDSAAIRIVRLSAPFAPFTGELARKYDQIEIIRTWRFERGDRLSSH